MCASSNPSYYMYSVHVYVAVSIFLPDFRKQHKEQFMTELRKARDGKQGNALKEVRVTYPYSMTKQYTG